jgi:SAM-dependent methyltransferase
MTNPWIQIPADDYEAHMASPDVAQLQALNALMAGVLAEFTPSALAVMGCTTGNGFEHVDTARTQRVVGVDINPEYLGILEDRFMGKIPGLELIEADFASLSFKIEPVSMVFAALVFEYVDVCDAVHAIDRCLAPGGLFVAALQMPSPESAPVTPTPYVSLELLAPIMSLVSPADFSGLCGNTGLGLVRTQTIPLRKGKALFVGFYRKGAQSTVQLDCDSRYE